MHSTSFRYIRDILSSSDLSGVRRDETAFQNQEAKRFNMTQGSGSESDDDSTKKKSSSERTHKKSKIGNGFDHKKASKP